MLVAAGEFNDLRHLGFRNVVGENAADTDTVTMDMQHDFDRRFAALVEDLFQNADDEFRRRAVVAEDEHLLEAGFLCFRARFRNDAGARVTVSSSLAALSSPVTSVFHCRLS